jgi:hypothetical protein
MRRDHRPVHGASTTNQKSLSHDAPVIARCHVCPGHKQRSRRSRNGSSGYSESRQRRLTWLVHVTAIITSCEPPKVVGEITSSVTVTGVPEVYGLPKTDRNHVGLPARSCLPIRRTGSKATLIPGRMARQGRKRLFTRWQNSMTDRGAL